MNKIYDIKKDIMYEEETSKLLKFLYNNLIGRLILKVLISKPISVIGGVIINSRISKLKIKSFIKKNNIDMSDYDEVDYKSFNDFFIRDIKTNKRIIKKDKELFIAPADSRLTVYKIDKKEKLKIKNSIYTVEELTGMNTYDKYKNGYALVFRLAVDDYHHYVYIDSGTVLENKKINGKLHTVNPIALKKYKVFSENSREITKLSTSNFGEIMYIEVGALMVGKIVNKDVTKFKRGEEKGYFKFGGSTVVILVKENVIDIDKKILDYSKKDIEVRVKLGDVIGKKVMKK